MNEPSRKDRDEAISRRKAECERLRKELETAMHKLELLLDTKEINHGHDGW